MKEEKETLDCLRNLSWGSHICIFYDTKSELIDILVPFFKEGLENNEYCIWAIPETIKVDEAGAVLRNKIEDFDRYVKEGRIEIKDYRDIYIKDGVFSAFFMVDYWGNKEKEISSRGFSGIRVSGDGTGLAKLNPFGLCLYEQIVNEIIGNRKVKAVCTYSRAIKDDIKMVARLGARHELILTRHNQDWLSHKPNELDELIKLFN